MATTTATTAMANGPTDGSTGRQTDGEPDKQTSDRSDGQPDVGRAAVRQTDREVIVDGRAETHRRTGRWTGRWTGGQSDKWAGGQPGVHSAGRPARRTADRQDVERRTADQQMDGQIDSHPAMNRAGEAKDDKD